MQYDIDLAFQRKKEYITTRLEELGVFEEFNIEDVKNTYMKKIGNPYNSYTDIPGKSALVIELPNCNMQCGYCNKCHLVEYKESMIDEFGFITIVELLEKLLDSRNIRNVVISGGEPYYEIMNSKFLNNCFITKLITFIIHRMNRTVKVHTNGTNYSLLYSMYLSIRKGMYDIYIPDIIAIDIKCSRETYPILFNTCAVDSSKLIDNVFNSLNLLQYIKNKKNGSSIISIEVITPLIPNITSIDEIERLLPYIESDTNWKFKRFIKKGKHIDPVFDRLYDFLDEEEYILLEVAKQKVNNVDFIKEKTY